MPLLAFLLVTFSASLGSCSLTGDPSYLMNIDMDGSCSAHAITQELPECLKLGSRRTTWQIFWSCLATIFSCIWVAIHPNLPGPRDTGFQNFRRRVTMAIIAIIGPEIIAIFATRQRMAAQNIKKEFNEKFNGGDDSEVPLLDTIKGWFMYPFSMMKEWFTGHPSEAKRKWTLTHGFFVQMGGFMMYREGEPIQVLTFDRLLKAIERGEIDVPHIPEEDITDKSKGDALSKLVVVLQTTWFVAQCLGRWISHLPVTELEVLTLAFAVLNAYIYALWWSKPQGALVPIKLELKAPPPFPTSSTTNPVFPENPTSSQSSLFQPSPPSLGSFGSAESLMSDKNHTSTHSTSFLVHHEDGKDEESGGPIITVDFDKESSHWIRREINRLSPNSENPMKQIVIDMPIASSIIVLYPFLVAWKAMVSVDSKATSGNSGKKFGVGRSRVPMFYVDNERDVGNPLFDIVPYFVIPLIFGGVHITLWSAPCRTSTEQLLWQISTVYITAGPVTLLFMVALTGALAELKMQIATNLAAVASFITAFLYPIARGILIYISLYALTCLPEHAYREIQWSNLLPHI